MAHGSVAQRDKERSIGRAEFCLVFFPSRSSSSPLADTQVSPRDQLIISVICMKIYRKATALFTTVSAFDSRYRFTFNSIFFFVNSTLRNRFHYDCKSHFAIANILQRFIFYLKLKQIYLFVSLFGSHVWIIISHPTFYVLYLTSHILRNVSCYQYSIFHILFRKQPI